MPNITLNFDPSVVFNVSLSRGDTVYYCPTASLGGFDTVDHDWDPTTGMVELGRLVDIMGSSLIVNVPDPDHVNAQNGDFIMFSKNNTVNLSSILGYYSEVTLKNNSASEAELFSVGTQASESSK